MTPTREGQINADIERVRRRATGLGYELIPCDRGPEFFALRDRETGAYIDIAAKSNARGERIEGPICGTLAEVEAVLARWIEDGHHQGKGP